MNNEDHAALSARATALLTAAKEGRIEVDAARRQLAALQREWNVRHNYDLDAWLDGQLKATALEAAKALLPKPTTKVDDAVKRIQSAAGVTNTDPRETRLYKLLENKVPEQPWWGGIW